MHFRHHGPDQVELSTCHTISRMLPPTTTTTPLQVQIRVWPTFPPTVGSMCHRCIGGGPGQYSGAAGKARLYDKKAGGERSSHLGIRTRATRSTMLLIVHQRRICSNTTTSGSGPQHRTLRTRNILLLHIYENTLQLLYATTYQHKSALHLLSLSGKGFCDQDLSVCTP